MLLVAKVLKCTYRIICTHQCNASHLKPEVAGFKDWYRIATRISEQSNFRGQLQFSEGLMSFAFAFLWAALALTLGESLSIRRFVVVRTLAVGVGFQVRGKLADGIDDDDIFAWALESLEFVVEALVVIHDASEGLADGGVGVSVSCVERCIHALAKRLSILVDIHNVE